MSENGAAAGLLDRICAATRAENRAAGERLVAVGEFDLLRLREHGEHETWGTDTYDATCAEVAAALAVSQRGAEAYLDHARALRSRLPKVGALLCAGDISSAMFRTIVYRTELITDDAVMATVDAALALKLARWPSMTRSRLAGYVDKVVARADHDAVRQRRERQTGREFGVWDGPGGVSEVFGRLLTTDARVVDARLDALAATVCDADPRSRPERRADALGALAAGAQRLQCRCGRGDCPAAAAVASAVVVHVVAEQQTLDGAGDRPGSLIDADALIPPELVAELAATARRQPLRFAADTAPERGYSPSRALADFVRCRDLTCRFPGCDAPATGCDVDHTIPHADGGATHASNLKMLCRRHHLVKTFWGWHDRQLPDATVIWTSPSGQTYITTPGSALLFPNLCAPTGHLRPPAPVADKRPDDRGGERTARMPKRRRSRADNRARYVVAERRRNHHARRRARDTSDTTGTDTPAGDLARAGPDDDPPPF